MGDEEIVKRTFVTAHLLTARIDLASIAGQGDLETFTAQVGFQQRPQAQVIVNQQNVWHRFGAHGPFWRGPQDNKGNKLFQGLDLKWMVAPAVCTRQPPPRSVT